MTMIVPSFWNLWCLVGLLQSTQVFGVYNPLVSVHRNTLTTTYRPLVTRQRQSFDMARVYQEPISVNSVVAIRGGGIGSMISEFNDYIGASKARSWAVLAFSVLFDTVSVALLKTAQAKSSQKQAIQTIAISFFGFFLSLAGFTLALKTIDVSIAYAIWAAAGTAIVSVAGVVFFGERLDTPKIICLTMIVLGVVGLELADRH